MPVGGRIGAGMHQPGAAQLRVQRQPRQEGALGCVQLTVCPGGRQVAVGLRLRRRLHGQRVMVAAQHHRAAGGQVLAQDEASSVVWGMPGALARHNVAHAVLPLDQLDAEVADRARGLPPPGRVSYAMLPPREASRGH